MASSVIRLNDEDAAPVDNRSSSSSSQQSSSSPSPPTGSRVVDGGECPDEIIPSSFRGGMVPLLLEPNEVVLERRVGAGAYGEVTNTYEQGKV